MRAGGAQRRDRRRQGVLRRVGEPAPRRNRAGGRGHPRVGHRDRQAAVADRRRQRSPLQPALDLVVMATGIYRGQDGSLVAALPDVWSQADPKIPLKNLPKPLFVVGAKLLFGTAESLSVVRLDHGRADGEPDRLDAPWLHDSAGQPVSDHDPLSGQRRLHRPGIRWTSSRSGTCVPRAATTCSRPTAC